MKVGLKHARSEYERAHLRLSMFETKSQFMAAVAGVLIGLCATVVPPSLIPKGQGTALATVLALVALVLALVLSLSASAFMEVDSPESPESFLQELHLLRTSTSAGADDELAAAVADLAMSYVAAKESVEWTLKRRSDRIHWAQVLTFLGLLFLIAGLLLPWVGLLVSAAHLTTEG